ncbi:hypothetical protein D3C85_1320450 [compost metagenome]
MHRRLQCLPCRRAEKLSSLFGETRLCRFARCRLRLWRQAFTPHQHFIRRFTIDRFVIPTFEWRAADQHGALGVGQWSDPRLRRRHQNTLDHLRRALVLQGADQRFADTQLSQHRQGIERRIRPEAVGHRPQGFLFFGGERAQAVLDAQAQLRQHIIRQVAGRLGDEIHAHAF